MKRIVVLIAALAAALAVAPAALAATGNLTWAQPGSFTTASPGANPDHDSFGATPWVYASGSATSPTPLTSFGTQSDGLSGWVDSSGDEVAADPANRALLMAPASGKSAALVWTSPTGSASTVSVTGSVTAAAPSADNCGTGLGQSGGYSWALYESTSSSAAASGSVSATGLISLSSVALPAGGKLTLLVSYQGAGLLGSLRSVCERADATLQIATPASGTPAVTLTSPTAGATIGNPAQPTFSGAAAAAFGASSTVTVSIYSGSAATGTAVQTLTAPRSGSTWAIVDPTPLSTGTYTVVASQSDGASPPDTGTSTPVTFTVQATSTTTGGGGGGGGGGSGGGGSGSGSGSGSGGIVLNAPPGAYTSGTFTVTGSAPTIDAGNAISLLVYAGTSATGSTVDRFDSTIASDGTFSFSVTPALSDNIYTLEAVMAASGTTATTAPLQVLVKANAPNLSLLSPLSGGTNGTTAVFFGIAGDNPGDASTVTLALYQGVGTGTLVGTDTVTRSGAGWVAVWPSALKLGLYTVLVSQTDVVGHTTTSRARTFLVVKESRAVIGSTVAVSQNGTGSVAVTCAGHVNTRCAANVKVVTTRKVTVGKTRETVTLFSRRVSMRAASTLVVRARLPRALAAAVHKLRRIPVKVTVTLTPAGGKATTYTAARTATIAR